MSLSALATLLSLTIACFKEYRPRWLLKGGPECPLSNTRPGPDKSRVGRSAGRRAARLGLGEEAEAGWAWTPRLASNQGKRKIRTGVAGNGGWDEREQKGPTEGERGCGAGRSRSASTSSAPSLSTLRGILYLSPCLPSPPQLALARLQVNEPVQLRQRQVLVSTAQSSGQAAQAYKAPIPNE